MRSSYQILILPYIFKNGKYYYALFKREDMKIWQAVAGGGEEGETPLQSAKREAEEETGITSKHSFIKLASMTTMPVENVCGFRWGENICVIPEFCFGVEVFKKDLKISHEHSEFGWFCFEDALKKLKWDSNKTALGELNHRLLNKKTNTEENINCVKDLL